jgi:hypothetical protein
MHIPTYSLGYGNRWFKEDEVAQFVHITRKIRVKVSYLGLYCELTLGYEDEVRHKYSKLWLVW